ncbi:MAG: sensor domain-containing protein, partial [Mycobacteriaceae bacterium]|nr:sensor domain-containing protein [Mycobacteriaceae bacterium]
PDTVRWNKEQTDIPLLWVCYGQGRVRSNVLLAAMVCEGDDAGAQKVGAIADRMSASVWDLAGS